MFRSLVAPAPALVQDVALLLARVVLGVVLIAHGWQKLVTNGADATAGGFEAMGIPAPTIAAWFAIAVELGGGVLLLLGLLTPIVGVLVAAVMAGAFWFAHRGATILSSEGGWELVAVLGFAGLALAAVGPGRLSLDAALVRRSTVASGEALVEAEQREVAGAR